jgi:Family of unknown function (DUF5996)
MEKTKEWPSLPYEAWLETYETLHLYTQVVGKIKLALSPFLNEWWHVALAIWARGITTGPIPFGTRLFEIRFDFISHRVEIFDSIGNFHTIELAPRPVAEFYKLVLSSLNEMGIEVTIAPEPQEMENTIPLETDLVHCSYDKESIQKFWTILASISGVFESFRSGFAGKSSPVQFWWGSFDLSISRYCGQPCTAPPKANRMSRIGCDEEHFAAGFWPGNGKLQKPAFYAYGYPAAQGTERASITPKEAYWNADLGEFILHYDDVCASPSADKMILDFLTSTYELVANSGHWDREFLERKVE